MCILFWTVDQHPKYRFVFAANRDEFLHRPTAKAHFWPPPQSDVLAGTDLEEAATPNHNGTWLGITRTGRFAALTNYRETKYYGKRSRGELVRDFLVDKQLSAHDYMEQVQQRADAYGGFSLICINLSAIQVGSKEMVYFSNRKADEIQELKPGTIYGLSNSVLDEPWKKVLDGNALFKQVLESNKDTDEDYLVEKLFELLCTTQTFTNDQDLNVIFEKTKRTIFTPQFKYLKGTYGTRTSTVILVDHQGNVTFVERDWYKLKQEGDVERYVPVDHPTESGVVYRFKINSRD